MTPLLPSLRCLALFSLLAAAPALAVNEGENTTDAAVKANPAMLPVADVPGLPRVLLIGDSVSIGYTLQVRALLKDKANVHRIPVNGGTSASGLANLASWLGDGKWDVIHVNFGLHDAKRIDETTSKVPRDAYERNLRDLAARLKATGAKIVWATTTPVPDDLLPPTRRFDDIAAYNAIARKVMEESGATIDDLYAVVLPRQAEIQRPHDVHFQPPGYDLLAQSVAASIAAQLPAKP